MSPDALHALVQYLYGRTDIRLSSMEDTQSLIRTSSMMLLQGLQDECTAYMHDRLSVDCALRVLEFSSEMGDTTTRSMCLEILADHLGKSDFASLLYAFDT